LAVLAVLAATLWPFNPFPPNGVTWLRRSAGLRFEKDAVVVSSAPLLPPQNDVESYTLELLVRPAKVTGSQTILGFYRPGRTTQLLVRQYEDGLLVTRDARIDSDPTKTIKFDVDHVFTMGRLVLVTISFGLDGTAVFLDGQLAEHIRSFKISRNELSGAELIVGTSPVTFHPWKGDLCGLAIYAKELTPAGALEHYKKWMEQDTDWDLKDALALYDFDGKAAREVHDKAPARPNLEIPETFFVPHKEFLRSPASEFKPNWNYVVDVLLNIAGFVPLGVIVCAYLLWSTSRRKAITITTVACALLSLTIEILQYYIPRRGSGITDVITNSLGALIGAILLQFGWVRRTLEEMKLMRRI